MHPMEIIATFVTSLFGPLHDYLAKNDSVPWLSAWTASLGAQPQFVRQGLSLTLTGVIMAIASLALKRKKALASFVLIATGMFLALTGAMRAFFSFDWNTATMAGGIAAVILLGLTINDKRKGL